MRSGFRKLFKGGGIVAIAWTILRTLWDFFGHASTAQWVWDIVKDWPVYLRYAAFIVGSNWFPLVLAILCLVGWWLLNRKERDVPVIGKASQNHDQAAPEIRQEQAPPQSIYYDLPPPPDLSDPAYDRMWLEMSLSDWRDSLINTGQPLMEWWTMRLDYPDKQRRESDSINWLSEVNRFAKRHLKDEQKQRLMQNYSTAMKMDKRVEFSNAVDNAGTTRGTSDHDLAFEIACKVKLLERFRSEPVPQIKESQPAIAASEAENTNRGRQLKALRDKLKNLLNKRERIATKKSTPGFDMDEARRRNERYIAEVRAEIERVENEQS